MCIYHVSCFSIFLVIFHCLKSVIFIFCDFQFSRHIPVSSVCISHFSRFSVISSFFKSSIVCISFSMIFSFLSIFHVLQWIFLFFQLFQFSSPHFTSYSVCFSFSTFSVILPFWGPTVCIHHFSCFSKFLVIFHYVNSVILIFSDVQFSRHIPGP